MNNIGPAAPAPGVQGLCVQHDSTPGDERFEELPCTSKATPNCLNDNLVNIRVTGIGTQVLNGSRRFRLGPWNKGANDPDRIGILRQFHANSQQDTASFPPGLLRDLSHQLPELTSQLLVLEEMPASRDQPQETIRPNPDTQHLLTLRLNKIVCLFPFHPTALGAWTPLLHGTQTVTLGNERMELTNLLEIPLPPSGRQPHETQRREIHPVSCLGPLERNEVPETAFNRPPLLFIALEPSRRATQPEPHVWNPGVAGCQAFRAQQAHGSIAMLVHDGPTIDRYDGGGHIGCPRPPFNNNLPVPSGCRQEARPLSAMLLGHVFESPLRILGFQKELLVFPPVGPPLPPRRTDTGVRQVSSPPGLNPPSEAVEPRETLRSTVLHPPNPTHDGRIP